MLYILLVVVIYPLVKDMWTDLFGNKNSWDGDLRRGKVYDYNKETKEFVLVN